LDVKEAVNVIVLLNFFNAEANIFAQ
jgi:hypothetical protein